MQPRPPPERIRQAVAADGFIDDHRNALAVVAELRAATTPAAALASARRASAFLEAHMAEEEAPDGVFMWLGALEPALNDELDRLVAQHGDVREALVKALGASEADATAAAVALADLLDEHEAAERRALERAVGRG